MGSSPVRSTQTKVSGPTLSRRILSEERSNFVQETPPICIREDELVIGARHRACGIEFCNELPRAFESYPQRFFRQLKVHAAHADAFTRSQRRVSARTVLLYYKDHFHGEALE